jgi:hypothetical protein
VKWIVKTLELSAEQLNGTKDVDLPDGAIPITMSGVSLWYIQPETNYLGSCQVIGCLEEATVYRKFECFRVKLCTKHGEEFAPQKEET